MNKKHKNSKNELRNCPVCNTLNDPKFSINEKYHYIKCQECGMVYSNMISKEENLKKHYEDAEHWERKIINKTEQKRKYKIALKHSKILAKYIHKNNSILDIGCGSGDFLRQLKKEGFQALSGVEPNKAMQQSIKQELNICIYGDVSEIKQQKFDCISLVKVIEHLSDPSSVINRSNELLNENGLLFLVFPRIGGIGEKIMKEKYYGFQKEHINWFTKNTIIKFLEKHNFKVVNIKTEKTDAYQILSYLLGLNSSKSDLSRNVSNTTTNINQITFKNTIKSLVKKPFSLTFYNLICPLISHSAGICGMGDYLIVIARKQ